MSELAIASVAIQAWEKPFSPEESLDKGTAFSVLVKPFFAEAGVDKVQKKPNGESGARLLEIQQISFQLLDIQMFLDTHPGEKQALGQKVQLQQRRKELLSAFAKDFYPLTMDCEGEEGEEMIPWEGGKKHVVL